jgi:predicted PurR-regulated permease PerM
MPERLHPPELESAFRSEVAPAGIPGLRELVGMVAAAIAVAALYFGREVLIPVTLAMLLSFVLSPLVELLRRIWLGRILSVVLAVVLALGLILALGSAIGTQVAQLSGNLLQYQATIETKISGLRKATIDKFSAKLGSFASQLTGSPPRSEAPAPAPAGTPSQGQQQKPVPVVIAQPAASVLNIGKSVLEPMLYPMATAGIILVVTIFALLQKEDLRDRAIRLLGSGDLHRTTVAMDEAGRRLSRYFLTQLGLNASFGIIVGAGLYFIGVPNPLLWGILGTLLRFVPYVGSWIAAALPIVLAAAVEPGWSMAIWTAVLYTVTELVIGQAVEPLVYGHSTGLSPVAVIITAIFWTWIWGPIGLIISTPLTLCLVVLGRHIERLAFFDVLLGDRPALTPTESLYQRMLAGDPDEAEEQAERYLADQPLSSYYDEVVLQALRLAANDTLRGTLEPPRLERFVASMDELIHDLGERTDLPGDRRGCKNRGRRGGRSNCVTRRAGGTGGDRRRPAGAGMADRDAGAVHCRARGARRIGCPDARPAPRQARAQRPRRAIRGRLAHPHRRARRRGCRDDVHLVRQRRRQHRPLALPAAAAARAPAPYSAASRPVAGAGYGARRWRPAPHAGRRFLCDQPARGGAHLLGRGASGAPAPDPAGHRRAGSGPLRPGLLLPA